MSASDVAALIHPAIAVTCVLPLIGIVSLFAWKTRQRRLMVAQGGKSKIDPTAGREHVQIGRWLASAVVGLALLGIAYPLGDHIINNQVWQQNPFQVIFIILMYIATIAAYILLLRARQPLWRGIFATLSGMGLVILGCQDGVFRRTDKWYISHYYYGIAAALLMIFSVAIIENIYKDRSNKWRYIHTALNCFALLLFIGQGITGARDLLEIPLSWQKPYIYKCDFQNLICPEPASQSSTLGEKSKTV